MGAALTDGALYLRLVIPGPPQGQGRPRIGKGAGGRPMAFTPTATRAYAQQIQGEWIAAGRRWLSSGPYRLELTSYAARPAGHYRKDGTLSAAGERATHPGKPDLDNVIKGVLDALCAVGAVPDDRFLVEIDACKRWAGRESQPRVIVEFSCLAPLEAEAAA